jgi:uncharacterized protein (TIGR02646 family)
VRSITKSAQPRTVTSVQCAPTTKLGTAPHARAAFDQLDKADVREALAREQGHLCGFCMRRIRHDGQDARGEFTTKIAHRQPIHVSPGTALTWSNLLASCDGGQRASTGVKTCDYAQGHTALTVDPTSAHSVRQLRYERGDPNGAPHEERSRESTDGLYLRTDNPQLRTDVETLGLNGGDLPALRGAALKAFRALLQRKPKHWTPSVRAAFFATWKAAGAPKLPDFVGVVEAWVAGQDMHCQ